MDKISFLKKEIDKISKCIFVIALSLFFDWSLSAQTFNVSYQNAPLSEILLDISKQYNIKVAFDHEKASSIYINKTISESSVEALLKNLLQDTDLTYEYRYNHYLIHDINKKQSSAICQIIGVVSDEENGEALPYANVIILNDFSYAITSSNGVFSIKDVKVNPIHLNISYIGYEQLDTTIKWTDSNIKLDLKLKRNPYQLASIIINGRNNEVIDMRNNGNVSVAINAQKLIDLPTVTETDVFRALQLLPGVNYLESSTGISIRGSSSDQNLILFDGQTIYNLSHYYGFVSALNPNVIKDVQIYKGGYDVQYGERVSGIIDITSKNGDKEKAKVYGDINLLSANLTTEIPINKKISMIAAVRRSYSDIYATELAENMSKKSMSQFINDPSTIVNVTKPSYYFYDYNFKMTIRPKKYETFLLNSYGGKDYYRNVYTGSLNDILISGDDKDIWKNYGFSGSWQRQWNESLYSDTQIGTSGYYDESNSLSRIDKTNAPEYLSDYLPFSINDFGKIGYNNIRDLHISSKFQYQISNNNQLDFGAIIRYTDIKYKKSTSNQLSYDDIHFAGNIASVYAQDKIDIKGNITIKPGIRINYYSGNKNFFFEPRLSINYTPKEGLSFRLSTGKYNQFISKVASVQETNYNNSFWVMANNREHPVLKSNHYIIGATYEKKKFLIDIEAYYKTLKGIQEFIYISEFRSNYDLNNFYDANRVFSISNIRPSKYIVGTGKLYGIDILLKYSSKSYTSWISYSYGKSLYRFKNINSGKEFNSPYDVPHQLSWTNMYSLRKWNFGSNLLFTSGSTYITSNIYDDAITNVNRTFKRLPEYFRFDLSANYNMVISKIRIKSGVTFMNVFNSENYYDVNIKTYDFNASTFSQTTLVQSQSFGINFFVHFEF